MITISHMYTANDRTKNKVLFVLLSVVLAFSSYIIARQGVKLGSILLLLPFAVGTIVLFFLKPKTAMIGSLILSFFISGFSRYMSFQWGLGIDVFLTMALLGIFFKDFKKLDWNTFNKDFVLLSLLWMGFIVLQIFNPEASSFQAWFYAMRGVGFYQFLCFLIVVWFVKDSRDIKLFLNLTISLSILGALWGIKQKYIGLDSAEYNWLWVDGHHDEHVLFGVLRAFSFYSDAGQFGASQAMFALICFILMLGPWKPKYRIFFGIGFLLTFIGFGISGSRGALAIPAIGGIVFLFLSKNFKLVLTGLFALFLMFYLLKYTHVAHGNEQVRRMRTALADDNPSLNARLKNQLTFGNYLRTRPFGGGIGSAGYWGERFSPQTLLAQTPTDSYYVKIWAETGIVGLCLHVLMLGYFTGKGWNITWSLQNPKLRSMIMALYCGMVGVLMASYGNQVYSQMPTGLIMSIFIPLIFLAPQFDTQLNHHNS